MKRLGEFLPLPGWDACPSQGYPSSEFAGTHLYTSVRRGIIRVLSCPRTQRSAPDRAQTRIARSGVQFTNYYATMSLHFNPISIFFSLFLFFCSNYNIPGVLSPSASSVNVNKARSYGSMSGTRSGSFQRSNSYSNIYIPGTTPPQLFSAGSGYQPSVLVEQNEGQ